MRNPCNGCTIRNPFCHIPGNCLQEPSYHEWRGAVTAAMDAKRKASIVTDFFVRNVRRTMKQKNLREE